MHRATLVGELAQTLATRGTAESRPIFVAADIPRTDQSVGSGVR